MEYLSRLILVALVAVFAENIVLTRALGASTVLMVARDRRQMAGFGAGITAITTLSAGLAYFADILLLGNPSSYIYMPLIYVMIIGIVYITLLLCLWKWAPKLFVSIKKYVHISSFNCAVLGAMFLSGQAGSGLVEYLGFGLGVGLGFVLATYLVAEGCRRLDSDNVPAAFRGYPAQLVYIGVLSLAFYGLLGHAPSL